MKVIAFNGSARKDGNTAILLKYVLAELDKEGFATELYQLAGKKIHGCIACGQCRVNKDRRCAVNDDIANECIALMDTADGILIGSPTYFANMTPETKALIDRAGYVSMANGGILKRKAGAAVVAVRRGGADHVFNSINQLFLISQMIVPGSCYWNMGFGREKGEVEKDEEGLRTMQVLGQNMAWLLKKIHS
jgi:multimeric flavodoxin WrbA